ncbi:hypothetical protein [Nocardia sp. NPDC052566]|uniref:hypothetical protein n=1 Tax=Nocardia sp. NPDC052566 TaxID=3364330 RepID=UPI0037C52345
MHVDSVEDVERLRRLYPPVEQDPDPDEWVTSLFDERAPFSFEAMAADGVTAVHVTDRAATSVDAFYGWDIDSTVWLARDGLVARTPVPAAQLPAGHDFGDPDDRQWSGSGDDQAATAERRLVNWDFQSPDEALEACARFAEANPDNDLSVVANWSRAHEYAAQVAEGVMASAVSAADRAAAAALRVHHLAEFHRYEDRRFQLVRERLGFAS